MLAAVLGVPSEDYLHAQIADIKARPKSRDPVRRITDRQEIATLARGCALTGCHDCHRELRRIHECPCDRCKLYHRVEAWLSPEDVPELPRDLHPAGGTAGLTVVAGTAYGATPMASAPDRRMDAVADNVDLWLACSHLRELQPYGPMLHTAALFALRTQRGQGWYGRLATEMWSKHPHGWGEWLETHRINACDALLESVVLGIAERLEGWR